MTTTIRCGHCARRFVPSNPSIFGMSAATHCFNCRRDHRFLLSQDECPACPQLPGQRVSDYYAEEAAQLRHNDLVTLYNFRQDAIARLVPDEYESFSDADSGL